MWAYLEKQIRGGFDPLLEQNAKRPILLLEVENSSAQLQTLFSQILWEREEAAQEDVRKTKAQIMDGRTEDVMETNLLGEKRLHHLICNL